MTATLYPPIEPYATGMLSVSSEHSIYYEESGYRGGKPVVLLHGGPGGGTEPRQRRFFNPERYRIILFDQRGCGRSVPKGSLVDNTTWDLVGDIERLREHLDIDRWQVFGGSWGSTLALAYAQSHRERVTELVVRGVFTFAHDEVAWLMGGGTDRLFPEYWGDFVAAIPEPERGDLIAAYYRRLTGPDEATRAWAAAQWSRWECSAATLLPDPDLMRHCALREFSVVFSRIECHYFMNRGFFATPAYLLDNMPRLAGLPGAIIHGRYDVICPLRNAWRLHHDWPGSRLEIIEGAGHSANEPGITAALVRATDSFAEL